MTTLREILDKINGPDQEKLLVAFEEGISAYVEYTKGCFVGVNIKDSEIFSIEEMQGVWSKGTIKSGISVSH